MEYVPPVNILLAALGLTEIDLTRQHVEISSDALKLILSLIMESAKFDEEWYRKKYHDVEGSILARQYRSGKKHYISTGYFERRLPYEFEFDATWYLSKYQDLSNSFKASDSDALRSHFNTTGYFEGRAGIAAHFADAETWRARKISIK